MLGTVEWSNSIIHGDAKTGLAQLLTNSVHCIVTSPPYYQQRDYSTPLQIGNEALATDYIQNLRTALSECYRVLVPDGTLWLNLGDKYDDGELLGMPWQVAFALKADGWLLRSDIIFAFWLVAQSMG
jgi:DNA modification methylase